MKDINPDFNFFMPIDVGDLEKAEKNKGASKYDNMKIRMMASDPTEDSDEETLEPNGYILDRFLKYGFLNYDHKGRENPKYFIGEPTKAEVKNNKFFIDGFLYKNSQVARDVYDTMIMLKKSGSNRHMGVSIEGKALERDLQNPKRITKALITGAAITLTPKNTNTYADIVKGQYSEPIVKNYEYDLEKSTQSPNGGEQYLVDITNHETGIRYTIDKDLRLKVEKAISTETAKPLIKEDLERKLKILPFGTVNDAIKNVAKHKKKLSKSIVTIIRDNMDIYKKYM